MKIFINLFFTQILYYSNKSISAEALKHQLSHQTIINTQFPMNNNN